MTHPATHPARYTESLLPVMAEMLVGTRGIVLDPMAGTGERLDILAEMTGLHVVGIEIEPAWIKSPRVRQGDATDLPFEDGEIAAIVVSPTYGNGMNDYFRSSPDDTSVRNTYIHRARALTGDPDYAFVENNTSRHHFGSEGYARLHLLAWAECARVLRRGGRFVINTKNSTGQSRSRKGADPGRITEWHHHALELLGLTKTEHERVPVRGLQMGANRDRYGWEDVAMFRKIL